MANPKTYYTDLSQYAYTSSAGDLPGNTTANLLNYVEAQPWISSSTAAQQTLTINFGQTLSSIPRSYVLIGGHNLNGIMKTGTITVEACSLSDFSGGVQTIISIAHISSSGTYIADLSSSDWYTPGTPEIYQYWRIRFNGNLNWAPSIGNFWIDNNYFAFSSTYDWNYKTQVPQYQTHTSVALDGTLRASQSYAGRNIYEVTFSYQDNPTRTNFLDLWQTCRGRLYPFYFLDTDGATTKYFYFMEDYFPIAATNYGQNTISVKLQEQRTY